MALDLEVLTLIPAVSHLAVNRSRTCWRSWLEGTNKTTSSAKSRDEILWLPNQTPSVPWLRLEILSLKIMNRTGDKGQPCRMSDLLSAMRTRSTSHRMPRGTRSNAFSRSTKHMWTGWTNSHEPSSTLQRV